MPSQRPRAAFYGHHCCAVATAAALVIDPGPPCHVLVTVCGCAWVGASRCRLAQHGGNHGQRRQRLSAVLLYGIIRHGDCTRGRDSAHLMQGIRCPSDAPQVVCANR